MELVVASELGAVVEGDGLAQGLGEGFEQAGDDGGDRAGMLAIGPDGDEQARGSLMQGEERLVIASEHHEVGFPVAGD